MTTFQRFTVLFCFLTGGIFSYGQVKISKQYIFPLQSQHVHSSSLVELPNGDLLSCWFQGSGERKADDVKIMGARLKRKKNMERTFCNGRYTQFSRLQSRIISESE